MGQYGNPDIPPFNYLPVPDEDVWKLCYEHGQGFEAISVCDFWKDPNQAFHYLYLFMFQKLFIFQKKLESWNLVEIFENFTGFISCQEFTV